jgi:threonine synthase
MGLPIRKLILATNHNDVLHKFFETGCYCRANRAWETLAPAMDISISSNFERFLFYLADENSVILSSWMSEFESTGKMSVNEVCLARAREYFATFPARDEDITAVINQLFLAEGYLVCPHTGSLLFYFVLVFFFFSSELIFS